MKNIENPAVAIFSSNFGWQQPHRVDDNLADVKTTVERGESAKFKICPTTSAIMKTVKEAK